MNLPPTLNLCSREVSHGIGQETVTRDGAVRGVEFDAHKPAACEFRGKEYRAGAAERIEQEIAGAREGPDQGRKNAKRFLRWMQFVAGILPFDYVALKLMWCSLAGHA